MVPQLFSLTVPGACVYGMWHQQGVHQDRGQQGLLQEGVRRDKDRRAELLICRKPWGGVWASGT